VGNGVAVGPGVGVAGGVTVTSGGGTRVGASVGGTAVACETGAIGVSPLLDIVVHAHKTAIKTATNGHSIRGATCRGRRAIVDVPWSGIGFAAGEEFVQTSGDPPARLALEGS
jgi:hypothetical protein